MAEILQGSGSNSEMKPISRGLTGRHIPSEEMTLKQEQVERLATEVGGNFGDFIRAVYQPFLPKTK